MTIYGQQQAFEEGVSAVTATNTVDVGTRRLEGGREYVYCQNVSTEDLIPGRGARLASGGTGYSVEANVTAPATIVGHAPVGFCYNATMATNTYGWLVSHGPCPVESYGKSSVAIGDKIFMTESGVVDTHTALTDISEWGAVICGVARAALDTATTGSFLAFVDCRGVSGI